MPQLAVGVPLLDDGAANAGGVYVLVLEPADLSLASATLLTRASPGLDGDVAGQAQFGAALVAGDFDADGDDDLAVGAPGDTVGGFTSAGSVSVLQDSGGGLTTSGLLVHQDVADVPEVAESGDRLGEALAAGDWDDDGDADLAVGASAEALSGFGTAGGLLALEGSATLLLDLAQSLWLDKSLAGIAGSLGSNDTFGSALGPWPSVRPRLRPRAARGILSPWA